MQKNNYSFLPSFKYIDQLIENPLNMHPGAHHLFSLLSLDDVLHLKKIPTILVTGTNGKGSVCAILESVLRTSGLKTGLFTSPHILTHQERIRVNGNCISESNFESIYQKYFRDLDPNTTSFFELLTAFALKHFLNEKVDVLVVEIGLGGKLDTTNFLSPLVSILTNVSLDHTKVLGNTLEKIGKDKSLVSRRNHYLVLGEGSLKRNEGVLNSIQTTGCFVKCADELSRKKFLSDILTLLPYTLQAKKQHIQTALACIEILEKFLFPFSNEVLLHGIKETQWIGRFDLRTVKGKTLLLDVAHNPSGIKYFVDQWRSSPLFNPDTPVLFGAFQDKDYTQMLSSLQKEFKRVHLCTFDHPRAASVEELRKHIDPSVVGELFSSPSDFFESFFKENRYSTSSIIVLGSVALIGECMKTLDIRLYDKN